MKLLLKVSKYDLIIIRVVLLLNAVLAFAFYLMFLLIDPSTEDPLWHRIILASVSLLLLCFSFIKKMKTGPWITGLFYLYFCCLQLWVIYMTGINNFDLFYTLAFFFTSSIISLLFYKNPVLIFPFLGMTIIRLLLLPQFGDEGQPLGWSIIFIFSIACMSYYTVLFFFKLARSLVQQQHTNLELQVDARTAELRRSNESLEQFAYAASHDLQEPLRSVVSFVQLLDRKYSSSFDDQGKEYMNFIVQSAKRMHRLINDLLIYSRANNRPLIKEYLDLNELLDQVKNDLHHSIENSNTKLVYDKLPTVYGHDVQLRQLFQNLIQNSIKYAGDQSPSIKMEVSQLSKSFEIRMSDQGIGIPEAYHDKIFDLFKRVDNSDKKTEGTGIGLAICKVIMERHNGSIDVYKQAPPGTTFVLRFPRTKV